MKENNTEWIYCNAQIVANNTAGKASDETKKFIHNRILSLEKDLLNAFNHSEATIKNIAMAYNKNNFLNTSSFSYTECFKTIDNTNGFFKNVDPNKACNFLSKLNDYKILTESTKKRIIDHYFGFIKTAVTDSPSSSEKFWFLIQNSKQFRDFIIPIELLPGLSLMFEDIRDQNDQVQNKLQNLRLKFEQIDIPFIGKLPVTIESAIIFFPIASVIGFAVCCYLLHNALSVRMRLHKNLKNRFDEELRLNFVKPEYLWIQPEVMLKKDNAKFSKIMSKFYIPIVTFIFGPAIISGYSLYLIYNLLNSDIPVYIIPDVLSIDILYFIIILIIEVICFTVGIYYVLKKIYEYLNDTDIRNIRKPNLYPSLSYLKSQ